MQLLNAALVLFEKHHQSKANELFCDLSLALGNVYKKKGNINKAIQYYRDSLKARKERNDIIGVAALKSYIGDFYGSIQPVDTTTKANAWYGESLRLRTLALGCDNRSVATSLIKLGYYLIEKETSNLLLAERLIHEGTQYNF